MCVCGVCERRCEWERRTTAALSPTKCFHAETASDRSLTNRRRLWRSAAVRFRGSLASSRGSCRGCYTVEAAACMQNHKTQK